MYVLRNDGHGWSGAVGGVACTICRWRSVALTPSINRINRINSPPPAKYDDLFLINFI